MDKEVKKLKLAISNKIAIEEEIKDVERRSRERLLTYDQIVDTLEKVVAFLDITKKAMEGVKVDVDVNAQHFPRVYNGRPMSTHFTAEYSKGKWYITGISRERCREYTTSLHLSQSAKDAITKKFERMK